MRRQLKFDEIDTAEHGDWVEFYTGSFTPTHYTEILHHRALRVDTEYVKGVRARWWHILVTNLMTNHQFTEKEKNLDLPASICFTSLELCVDSIIQEIEEYRKEVHDTTDKIVGEIRNVLVKKGKSSA